jgi:hypothetical protein
LRKKNAQDFARIKIAVTPKKNWVYVVLTLGTKARNENELWQLYKGLYCRWVKLCKRFSRAFGKIEYVAVVEQHRDGVPHLNLLISNQKVAENCRDEGWRVFRKQWLEPHAVESGFGERTYIAPVENEEKIAGYIVKLTKEVAKVSQIPVSAPRNFRRLRASVGLLPKPFKNKDYSGVIVSGSKEDVAECFKREGERVEVKGETIEVTFLQKGKKPCKE